jgi:hypothetical protein
MTFLAALRCDCITAPFAFEGAMNGGPSRTVRGGAKAVLTGVVL